VATNSLLGDSTGIVVGNAVTGDDFFDREQELHDFLELIAGGTHVMVTAPRRIGKTSLLLEAGGRLGDRCAFLFVDVQACTSEVDAVLKLTLEANAHRDIGRRILDAFRNVFGKLLVNVEEIGVAELTLKLREGLSADWQVKSNEILDRLAQAEKPVIVCLDELPILVSAILCGEDRRMTPERIDRARVFLSWLREATIRHRGKIRFVVSGSIGLEPLLARAGISETMNTFAAFPLSPWGREVALAYIEDRARRNGIRLEAGAAERLLRELGDFIPHHVALFVHFVRLDARHRKATVCTKEDVERIYREKMLSVHGHVDLATYEDRLKRVVAPEAFRAALELLTEAAMVGRLTAETGSLIVRGNGFPGQEAIETLRFLLGVFEHDGYLKRSKGHYVFVSHLLRDWWRNRFGFGYVPAAER
jgi:hypothetical protein